MEHLGNKRVSTKQRVLVFEFPFHSNLSEQFERVLTDKWHPSLLHRSNVFKPCFFFVCWSFHSVPCTNRETVEKTQKTKAVI